MIKRNIKSHLLILGLLLAGMILTSCGDDDLELSLNISAPSRVLVGEEFLVNIVGDADAFSIYTGDEGHNYDSSYLALTEGKEVDSELVVLTADSLAVVLTWLEPQVNNFNANLDAEQDALVFSEIERALTALVGVEFEYYEAARYYIATEILVGMESVAVNLVNNFFEDRSTLLAPEGGYHTGVALNRYNLNYSYAYSKPGEYTITVIATRVSNKKYQGSGYNDVRGSDSSEYGIERLVKEVTIMVEE